MSWKDIVADLSVDLGEKGLDYVIKELDKIEGQATDPWMKVSLAMVGELLEKHGIEGLELARELIMSIGDNKVPDLSDLSIATASDVVAQLQNAEAAERKLQQKYIVIVTDVLAQLIKGLVLAAAKAQS